MFNITILQSSPVAFMLYENLSTIKLIREFKSVTIFCSHLVIDDDNWSDVDIFFNLLIELLLQVSKIFVLSRFIKIIISWCAQPWDPHS